MSRGTLSLVVWALFALQAVFPLAADEQKAKVVSSVSVEGLVFCDPCLQEKKVESSNVLKGAKVAVVCESKTTEEATSVEVVAITDANGKFKAEVPKSAFDGEGKISCAAELKESPVESCNVPGKSRLASGEFRRQEGGGDAVVYAAGELTYHRDSPGLFCAQDFYFKDPFKKPLYKAPMYQNPWKKPMYKEPTYKAPMYKPPMYKPPMYKPPMYKPPVYKPPVYKPPGYKPPTYKWPSYKPTSYKAPSYKAPSYKLPTLPKFQIPKFNIPKFQIPKFTIPKYKYPPAKP